MRSFGSASLVGRPSSISIREATRISKRVSERPLRQCQRRCARSLRGGASVCGTRSERAAAPGSRDRRNAQDCALSSRLRRRRGAGRAGAACVHGHVAAGGDGYELEFARRFARQSGACTCRLRSRDPNKAEESARGVGSRLWRSRWRHTTSDSLPPCSKWCEWIGAREGQAVHCSACSRSASAGLTSWRTESAHFSSTHTTPRRIDCSPGYAQDWTAARCAARSEVALLAQLAAPGSCTSLGRARSWRSVAEPTPSVRRPRPFVPCPHHQRVAERYFGNSSFVELSSTFPAWRAQLSAMTRIFLGFARLVWWGVAAASLVRHHQHRGHAAALARRISSDRAHGR